MRCPHKTGVRIKWVPLKQGLTVILLSFCWWRREPQINVPHGTMWDPNLLKRNFKLFDTLSAMFPINCHHFESFKVLSLFIIYNKLFTINPTDLQVAKLIEVGQSHSTF